MNKQYLPDLILLSLIVLFAFGLKLYYAQSNTEDLLLFLHPVSSLVELFTGTYAEFQPEVGYYFPQLQISVERSCSGVNFFIMAFCMVSISALPFYKSNKHKIIALIIWTLLAYLLSIGATSSRILIAIGSLQFQEVYPWLADAKVHQAQGGFVYLFFLILFYLSATFFNTKIARHYA